MYEVRKWNCRKMNKMFNLNWRIRTRYVCAASVIMSVLKLQMILRGASVERCVFFFSCVCLFYKNRGGKIVGLGQMKYVSFVLNLSETIVTIRSFFRTFELFSEQFLTSYHPQKFVVRTFFSIVYHAKFLNFK